MKVKHKRDYHKINSTSFYDRTRIMKAVVALTLVTLLALSIIQTTQAYEDLQIQNTVLAQIINDICNNPNREINQKCDGIRDILAQDSIKDNADDPYRQKLLDYAYKHQLDILV